METATTIWIIAILFIAVLIGNSIRKKKLKERNILKTLQDLANKTNGKISEYNHWFNTQIGIDKSQHQVYFIRKLQTAEVVKVINLTQIQNCRINNISRTVNNGNSNTIVIDKLELILTYKKPNTTEEALEFYNTNSINQILNDEFQLIEKWKEIINKELKNLN